jgi:hypothetical protein
MQVFVNMRLAVSNLPFSLSSLHKSGPKLGICVQVLEKLILYFVKLVAWVVQKGFPQSPITHVVMEKVERIPRRRMQSK